MDGPQSNEVRTNETLSDTLDRSIKFIRARQGFDTFNAAVVKDEVRKFATGEDYRRIQAELDHRATELLGANIGQLVEQRVEARQSARPSWQTRTAGLDAFIASLEVRGELVRALQEQAKGAQSDRTASSLAEFMTEYNAFELKSLFF